MEQKDISTLTITELEALGYRTIKELKIAERNLGVIEQLIEQKSKPIEPEVVAE